MWKPKELIVNTFNKVNFYQILACIFEVAGAGKPALRSIEKALLYSQNKAGLHLRASRLYLKLGQIDQAALHCKKAASGLGPGSFIYWLERANKQGLKTNRRDLPENSESPEEANLFFEAPMGDKISEFNNSGLCLLGNGRYREALTCFHQAIALGGNDQVILLNTGLALSKLNRHAEALDYYTEVQATGYSSPALLNNKGYSLFHLERYEESLACYEVARQYLPNDLTLLSNLASCYNYLGKVDEAIGCYQSAIKVYPQDATLYNNLGICLENTNRFSDALFNFEKAIDLSPNNCTFLLNYAYCLVNLGRYEDAHNIVSRILKDAPNNYPAWSLRGELLAQQGNMKEATKCYGKALGLGLAG
ncbi:Tetratricopeptide TPR_2 repeat protein [Desulforamulus reducens MI-1]|uniref:Tetratricopeptide TPR_2 repeat protein n=1 Tax=Desulforamulus reducens (strain ATCC BAA-1160 / DSM 100696 / MI-1) TaxID=349161 RepID=A4J5C5_DESRM|nr:tetratricopeptide repeat protein [Desulforamulus reducens]ABO50278.1 Tetratricopeptide TPR_2 repeat protein [Desulforamulus reducens MI-1]